MNTQNTASAATQSEAATQNDTSSNQQQSSQNATNVLASPADSPAFTEQQIKALGAQLSNDISERLQLSQDTTEAAKELLTRLSGTNPEDLTEEEAEILETLTEHAVRELFKNGTIRTSLSAEQNELLQKMYETRRTTARKTELPTLQDVFTKAIVKQLKDDSKSLFNQGRFNKVYGFAYEDFKKAFAG